MAKATLAEYKVSVRLKMVREILTNVLDKIGPITAEL
jgi:hypothetical protein